MSSPFPLSSPSPLFLLPIPPPLTPYPLRLQLSCHHDPPPPSLFFPFIFLSLLVPLRSLILSPLHYISSHPLSLSLPLIQLSPLPKYTQLRVTVTSYSHGISSASTTMDQGHSSLFVLTDVATVSMLSELYNMPTGLFHFNWQLVNLWSQ